ncbi:unnamed protein product [marine sediment metagenome]|uniref:Uncharacterized protein n=1 Tax=marine sediment metagenome TaxID=412755 RepID=X1I5J3_9ZZZZ
MNSELQHKIFSQIEKVLDEYSQIKVVSYKETGPKASTWKRGFSGGEFIDLSGFGKKTDLICDLREIVIDALKDAHLLKGEEDGHENG